MLKKLLNRLIESFASSKAAAHGKGTFVEKAKARARSLRPDLFMPKVSPPPGPMNRSARRAAKANAKRKKR